MADERDPYGILGLGANERRIRERREHERRRYDEDRYEFDAVNHEEERREAERRDGERREEQPSPENGETLNVRLGKLLHLRVRLRHAVWATLGTSLLAALGVAHQTNTPTIAVDREWKKGVDEHVASSAKGYERLSSVETEVQSVKTGMQAVVVHVDRLETRLLSQSLEATRQWYFETMRMPDSGERTERLRYLRDRIATLEQEQARRDNR